MPSGHGWSLYGDKILKDYKTFVRTITVKLMSIEPVGTDLSWVIAKDEGWRSLSVTQSHL